MISATSGSTLECADCGRPVSGKFCSDCGSRAPQSETAEGWGSVSGDIFRAPRSNGFFSVAWSFLKAPVDTVIRLADDPAYRSHWGFLTACVSAQLTLVFVILPRLGTAFLQMPDGANGSAVITNEVVQYAGMAIMTPFQYYICRALGNFKRTPIAYVKLCALSVSYGSIVSIASALAFFAAGTVILKTSSDIDVRLVSTALTVLSIIVILVFVTASHKRFWGLDWWPAIGLTTVFATVSWAAVYPALGMLAEKINVPGTLGYLLG